MPDLTPQTSELQLALALARVEGKLDRMNDRITDVLRDQTDHEARLRVIESKPVVTTRMLATVVVCGSALASIIPVLNLIHIGN